MTTAVVNQAEVDRQNSLFWDELCGSTLADYLGITDDSPASLALFDAWYFEHYPYLFDHIPFDALKGLSVLEIGLGYGTVSQWLAASGCHYHGLDIAAGPVDMVKRRLSHLDVLGDVRQGSVLHPPFAQESFDWIVAIGCLHHTGNLMGAIEQVHGLLKANGNAMIMVYSATSYRQWRHAPVGTSQRLFADPARYRNAPDTAADAGTHMRSLYDTNLSGEAAPQTEFVTQAELAHMCRAFRACRIVSENIGQESVLRFIPRRISCKAFGWAVGLDLYCHLQK